MSRKIETDFDFQGVARLQNLPDAASPQEPATKAQLDAAVEGLAWKDNVRVSTQGNLNLASPGATIDGITMVADDRVLVRAQTAPAENGIYIWNGAAVPMTRAPDASTFAELESAVVTVDEGTDATTSWRQTAVNGVIDTNSVTFGAFGTSAPPASTTVPGLIEIADQTETDTGTDTNRAVTPATLANWAGRLRKYAVAFGDGSATSFVLTHNLNSRDVSVSVRATNSPYDQPICDIAHTSVNSVTLTFLTAPTSNEFTAVVIG